MIARSSRPPSEYTWHCLTTGLSDVHTRARRAEYGSFCVFAVGFLVLAAAVEVGLLTGSGPLVIIGSIAVGLFAAWVLLALVTSSARRLHDLGLSGWFSLLVLVPVTGALAMLAGSLIDGKAASNRFGASPKYSAQ